jgi:hypothetical protein
MERIVKQAVLDRELIAMPRSSKARSTEKPDVKKSPTESSASSRAFENVFARVAATLRQDGGVDEEAPPESRRRAFGAGALKVNGKIFAMPVRGALVVKLPRARVTALVESGAGEYFDPGHGRLMREWVSLRGRERSWIDLAREARDFVKG